MLYREIMAVCSEIHTKHIYTVCGQNVGDHEVWEDMWWHWEKKIWPSILLWFMVNDKLDAHFFSMIQIQRKELCAKLVIYHES